MSTGITAARYEKRLGRAGDAVGAAGHTALLIGVGPEMEWLIGYPAHGLERLNLLVVPATGEPTLVVPRLEVSAALAAPGLGGSNVRIAAWGELEDPYALVLTALASVDGAGRLLVSDGLRAAFLLRLQEALPQARFGVASSVVSPLRQVKDAEEVALLRQAAAAADRVIEGILAGPLVGRSEADVAREVRDRLVAEGHDTAEFWIVASGPNSASPHHEPGDRVIAAGEPLLLDIGGRLGGYCSDTTRTAWVTGAAGLEPDDTFRRIHALVEEAAAAGREEVRPGTRLADIDRAARQVIEAAGYGEQFFHRLGHGIGLEVHEDPYVVAGNVAPLAAGHAFSVEPGIYLEGRYGVRIEDIVVCAAEGGETLNQGARSLRVVRGE